MPEPSRPLFNANVETLERLLEERRDDADGLRELSEELEHRTTDRAARLRELVFEAVEACGGPNSSASIEQRANPGEHAAASSPQRKRSESAVERPSRPIPPITNNAVDILSAWIALEVLSPPTFQKPERLAGDGFGSVAYFKAGRLPWEGKGESSRPRYKLFYQVVIGSIAMPESVERLLGVYSDKRPERPSARGEAILAVVLVDHKGCPIDSGSTSVSSFGWGLPIALRGDLSALGAWSEHEQRLADQLEHKLLRLDEDGNSLPLDMASINGAHAWLVSELGLPTEIVTPPTFAVRAYQFYKSNDPPETLLLNSFFLNDLQDARALFKANREPPILRRYLAVDRPEHQMDLLREDEALANIVRPLRFPSARWPVSGRHPLSLLQQAAVNLSSSVTTESSILAINGPPGTGKTTLLRDIVAAQIAERATAMSAFEDPEKAFEFSGQRIKAGQAWTTLYSVSDKLRGFEVLVASSNNKAVENVSAELPTTAAVADDSGLRYFKSLSDELLERDTWGVIAAVLGNVSNRSRFRERFWWDDDFGLMTYLSNAAGTPRPFERKDGDGQIIESRPPKIVTEEHAPRDHRHALVRWNEARTRFKATLKRSQAAIAKVEEIRKAIEAFPAAHTKARVVDKAAEIADALLAHWDGRPGFWSRLFRTRSYKQWLAHEEELREHAIRSAELAGVERSVCADLHVGRRITAAQLSKNLAARAAIVGAEARRIQEVATAGSHSLGSRIIDTRFFERSHEERHLEPPWLSDVAHRARDELFVASVALHKAFIDAAAKPLRNNLGALMGALSGRALGAPEKDALLPDLWASLFLVVPVVSTTFASVNRMLGALPPQALGWLLVDEAGQALPQAAVGALLRTRRAVVVGDPMQIEPVVMLPETLTGTICRHFGVDPDYFNAPSGSVQTLADAATPYSAEFPNRTGNRTVGVPLLVHRRCREPMFGVSNAVAYERLMVFGTPTRPSPIREALGPSRWINVVGGDQERWCPEEGEIVCQMLAKLKSSGIDPNIYIVTPFVMVQEGMRRAVLDSRVLDGWVKEEAWRWVQERIGTVHTVQGREAEGVILILGAQHPSRNGARGWAGGRPNLLNVAVTRAQEVLYVVGNRSLWKGEGHFRELHARLPASEAD